MEALLLFSLLVVLTYTLLLYIGFNNKWIWLILHVLAIEGFVAFHFLPGMIIIGFILLKSLVIGFTALPGAIIILFSRTKLGKKFLSLKISERERTALLSGDTWIEKDLFSGNPNIHKIFSYKNKALTPAERAFLKGPVERACALADDYKINEDRDLPPALWSYLRQQKFFGMIIPRRYGGLGFSAEAQSLIVQKLASRSYTLSVTVMVPNSLGPAELLLKYGTQRQKDLYLKGLATGKLLPCFALTESSAGSDASSITSSGILQKNKKTGRLEIRLTWRKRYITLAAVSDLLGIAFQLKDPKHLVSQKDELGITCALLPTKTKGVILGRRHDPVGASFYNCPTEGKDVIIGIENIIGEEKGLGEGWKMLMECLAAGRGISLPALSGGATKLAMETVGTYGYVRRQFGLPIYTFEGVAEKIAPIAGMTYIVEAARRYTTASIDQGIAAPVVSAIMKYHTTEMARTCINHAMDLLGGAGISRGRRNLLAGPYAATPIGITVEGANILTRSFIIFGQGLFRCHPHLYQELDAINRGSARDLSRELRSHAFHLMHVEVRATFLFLTRGLSAWSTFGQPLGSYKRKLLWSASTLAICTETAILLKGGALKRSEMLNGKLGDMLSWLYLLTAVLARYEHAGMPASDRPIFTYAMQYGLCELQKSFENTLRDLIPFGRVLAQFYKLNPFALAPSDKLKIEVTRSVVENPKTREALTAGIFVPAKASEQIQRLRMAYTSAQYYDGMMSKLQLEAKKRKWKINKKDVSEQWQKALAENIITKQELKKLTQASKLMADAIEVDSYSLRDLKNHKV